MSPRPRNKGNLDLPPHVEVDTQRGKTYYRYVLPNRQRRSLGTNKQEAIAAAMTLNVELTRNPDMVSSILQEQKKIENEAAQVPLMPFAIEQFKLHLAKKKLAVSTRGEQIRKLNIYKEMWTAKRTNEVTITDVANYLETKQNNAYVKHRILLVDFWTYLTHRGWAKENVPELTLLAIVEEKHRLRHTAEALNTIYEICPPWLQNAIDLARHSVQRRGDLVLMHKDMVNLQANTITVLQQKTRNYANPVFIEVDMHEELRAAVIACLSDKLAFICPYLLHDRPIRMPTKKAASKPHHLAITPDHLTKSFAEYRDKSGVYDHMTAEQKPSFHDIRALGLYELKNKFSKDYAQALGGHTSVKMTEEYFKGHEPIKPVRVSFTEAKAE